MALLPSIMSLFGGKPTPDQQISPPSQTPAPGSVEAQVANANGNPTVPSATTPTSNGSVAAIPAIPQGDGSPLANFADLWKTDTTQNLGNQSLVPTFNLDPKGLMEGASKINFTNHISQELVQKAMSGDAAAFLDVINQASQFGFANATMASGELVKNSLGSAQDILKGNILPAAMRDNQISQAINAENPIFQNPAVAPMLNTLRQQLSVKYPTSPPQEIANMAARYLSDMSTAIVSSRGGTVITKEQQQQQNANSFTKQPEQDWTSYFNS